MSDGEATEAALADMLRVTRPGDPGAGLAAVEEEPAGMRPGAVVFAVVRV